jgi:hypothetical protein
MLLWSLIFASRLRDAGNHTRWIGNGALEERVGVSRKMADGFQAKPPMVDPRRPPAKQPSLFARANRIESRKPVASGLEVRDRRLQPDQNAPSLRIREGIVTITIFASSAIDQLRA